MKSEDQSELSLNQFRGGQFHFSLSSDMGCRVTTYTHLGQKQTQTQKL